MRSMTTRTRMVLTGAVLAAVAAGVSGCAAGGPGYAALERPAEAGDSLPADLPADAVKQFDAASARFVAEDRGARLYLAESAESGNVCLLVYTEEEWFAGCGEGGHFGVSSQTRAYEVWADGLPPVEGATTLSPNVYATN